MGFAVCKFGWFLRAQEAMKGKPCDFAAASDRAQDLIRADADQAI